MHPVAHPRAISKGRPWPSFFSERSALQPVPRFALRRALAIALSFALYASAWAQEAIYRCGNAYTNAPVDVSRCERLATQAVTVISGTRPQSAQAAQAPQAAVLNAARPPALPVTANPNQASPSAQQNERDAQARTILVRELEKVQKQHQTWVQAYNQGAPEKLASDLAAPQKYTERVVALKAAIDRAERDIDSLQRELASRPVTASALKP